MRPANLSDVGILSQTPRKSQLRESIIRVVRKNCEMKTVRKGAKRVKLLVDIVHLFASTRVLDREGHGKLRRATESVMWKE